ncbi:MAG: doc [Parachlamydiales bacterium]|nr:doc [Parachlamydiales bacterium]
MEIYFLTLEDVLEIHTDQLKRYGGKTGIRDRDLLLSAIAQPLSTFDGQYLHKTLSDKAAAYLFHICQNHPFIDGNKRTALVSALMFLAMNNCPFDYEETKLEQLARAVAEGKAKKETIATFIAECLG